MTHCSGRRIAKLGIVAVSLFLVFVTVEWIALGCAGRRGRTTSVTGVGDYQAAADFNVGDPVSCRWRGSYRRYLGTVSGKSAGRLYIVYNDGDREYIAPELCVKRDGGGAASVAAPLRTFKGGGGNTDRVEQPAAPPSGGEGAPPSRPASDPAGEPDL